MRTARQVGRGIKGAIKGLDKGFGGVKSGWTAGGGKRTGRAGSHGWNSGGHVRTPRASEGERAEAPSMPILRVSVRLLACASCAGWGGWLAPHCGRLGWMVEVD